MVRIKGESTSPIGEVRAGIQQELDKPGGNFTYNDEGVICIKRPLSEDNIVYLPIDLDRGIADDPSSVLPLILKPKVLIALRNEVGWEPLDPGKKTG